jgi:uncharacterized protein (UPF0333 family)
MTELMTQAELQVMTWMEMLRDRLQREEGQGSMEYAVVALVVILAVAGVTSVMKTDIQTAITSALGKISSTIASVS